MDVCSITKECKRKIIENKFSSFFIYILYYKGTYYIYSERNFIVLYLYIIYDDDIICHTEMKVVSQYIIFMNYRDVVTCCNIVKMLNLYYIIFAR